MEIGDQLVAIAQDVVPKDASPPRMRPTPSSRVTPLVDGTVQVVLAPKAAPAQAPTAQTPAPMPHSWFWHLPCT